MPSLDLYRICTIVLHWLSAALVLGLVCLLLSGASYAAVFLFFDRAVERRNLTVFAGWSAGLFPLAFFGRRPDKGHGVIFPLFWHLRDAKGSATALVPLFYATSDEHGYHAGALPLSPGDETPSAPCDAQPDEWDIATAVDRAISKARMASSSSTSRCAATSPRTPC